MGVAGRRVAAIAMAAGLAAGAMLHEAWARAEGGISSGNRGARSASSPSRRSSAPSRPSSPSTRQPTPASPAPAAQPAPVGAAGGLWRIVAGGVLGGMLFRALGIAGGTDGFGGGYGLLDLLVLGGIASLIVWVVRRRRRPQEMTAASDTLAMSSEASSSGGIPAPAAAVEEPGSPGLKDLARGLAFIRQMDPAFDEAGFREWCSEAFLRIQEAWAHRDVDTLRPLLTEEMLGAFREQIVELRAKRQINKVEDIAVRPIEMAEAWQEQGLDYITVRCRASLLDYTVDETSGDIVAGSDREPVRFEEFWTWVRPVGPNPWRLSGVNSPD